MSINTNSFPRLRIALLASLMAWSVVPQLSADSLPFGFTVASVAVSDLSGNVCSQGNQSSATCSLGGATATAIVDNGQGGYAKASVGGTFAGAAAVTGYFFGLQGPSNVNVPILINGFASTQDDASYYGASYASYYIYSGSSTGADLYGRYFASANACAYLTGAGVPCMQTGQFSLGTSVASNSVFYVFFEAAAGGTNASALIDPIITIDPSFAQASQFTLVASPGVFPTATPSIPEPASAGMLVISGLAALVWLGVTKLRACHK